MQNFENCNTYGLSEIKKTQGQQHSQTQRKAHLVYHFKTSPSQSSTIAKLILQEDLLKICFNDSSQTFKLNLRMVFAFIYDHYNQNQEVIGFKIKVSRQQYYEFFCSTRLVIEDWKEAFSKYIFINGFYEDYKPIAKIGKGKNASVFLALKRTTNQKVAVKAFIKSQIKRQKNAFEALENEINILRKMANPYIIKFIASYETQKSYYLITEYVEGKTLKSLLQQRKLNYQESIKIVKQLGMALKYLAKNDIAHRDLKPQNIIICEKNMKPCIIDFGLATICKNKKYIYSHCGTPGYIAPQILNANTKQISPVVDIFSLGIILYILIYRKFPYNNSSNILQQNINAQFKFDTHKNSQNQKPIPDQAYYMLTGMLQTNPSNRFTAKKLIKNLQSLGNKCQNNENNELVYEKEKNRKQGNSKVKLLRSGSLDAFFKKKINRILS